MTKKSAASAKVKAPQPTIEEKREILRKFYDDQIWYIIQLADTQVILADRIDNMLNLRELAISFGIKQPKLSLLFDLMKESAEIYAKIKEKVHAIQQSDFEQAEYPAPFKDLVPDWRNLEDGDELDLLVAAIQWLSIRPFNDQITQAYHAYQQQKTQLGL